MEALELYGQTLFKSGLGVIPVGLRGIVDAFEDVILGLNERPIGRLKLDALIKQMGDITATVLGALSLDTSPLRISGSMLDRDHPVITLLEGLIMTGITNLETADGKL